MQLWKELPFSPREGLSSKASRDPFKAEKTNGILFARYFSTPRVASPKGIREEEEKNSSGAVTRGGGRKGCRD